jgi:hypothetical protein
LDTSLQRVETSAKYTFEDSWVRAMGLTGKISATLGYTFENNRVYNFQMQNLNYMGTLMTQGSAVNMMNFLGYYNPNYVVHRVGASLTYKW